MAVAIPCARSVQCFPCADEASNPFANFSVEPPDRNIFVGVAFRRVPNPPHNNWNQDSCVGVCESSVSQQDADDCARRNALECIINGQPPPNQNNRSWPVLFCNTDQSAQFGSSCYTMPVCTVEAFSVAEANALAQSLADYRVHDPALASPCGPSVTPPEPPLPPSECPSEVGAAIASLELPSPVTWNDLDVVPETATRLDLVFNNKLYVQDSLRDYSPGHYQLRYVSGLLKITGFAELGLPEMGLGDNDQELGYGDFVNCSEELDARYGIATTLWKYVPGDEDNPFTFYCGSVTFSAWANEAQAQDYVNEVFNNGPNYGVGDPLVVANEVYEHLNDGGNVLLSYRQVAGSSGLMESVPGYPLSITVRQTDGLIPEPRKVAIADYASLISQFSDPAVAAEWNGEFNTRTAYIASDLRWEVSAVGAFGGAKLSYITTHPTSSNGRGFQLDIYSPGAVLMWRGFRGVGSTPIGYFFRYSPATPIGPACILCTDNSDIPWEPD